MCGIAGYFSFKNQTHAEWLRLMARSIQHRGPDAEGYFSNHQVGLAHRRLSIIDLSGQANQPMTSASGMSRLIFNGEIFNYRELAAERSGWKTQSDSEVLLELFEAENTNLLHRLNGMFAFALYSEKEECLYLARDRMGVKPLYYFQDENVFVAGSEIKALLAVPYIQSKLTISRKSIAWFLHLGFIPAPDTVFHQIKKFPAGYYAVVNQMGVKWQRYWTIPSPSETPGTGNSISNLQKNLESAVQLRLISDVPVGTFLSGGIDSSLISALAQKHSNTQLKTFSIGFEEAGFDESIHAQKVAQFLKTDHHAFRMKESDMLQIMEAALDQFDEPFADSSAFPVYLVSQLARRHVKVILTGDGGDELFTGYGMYKWAGRLRRTGMKLFRAPLEQALSFGNSRMKRVSELLKLPGVTGMEPHIFSQEQCFFSSDQAEQLTGAELHDLPEMKNRKTFSAVDRQVWFDLHYYLPDDLLTKVDRSSMAHSLECRTPLLDYRVVQNAIALPQQIKMQNGELKKILKEILYHYVPSELFQRPKQGFSIPMTSWLKSELSPWLKKFTTPRLVSEQGILQTSYTEKIVKQFLAGDDYLNQRVWAIIVLNRWLQKNQYPVQ